MSDSETPGLSHPTQGGKSLQSLERPRYKSWRKKFRKMRHKFDGVLEENKKLFKEEQKLEGIAKRLREELDGLMELCLDMNQNPSLPPEIRYELSYQGQPTTFESPFIPKDITPEEANKQFVQYSDAVKRAIMPNVDLDVARVHIESQLAAQETEKLSSLEANVPHPISTYKPAPEDEDLGPGYMTYEQEADYLNRLDNNLKREPMYMPNQRKIDAKDAGALEDKHWAELTPRELERQVELLNPQSQHNWLKTHTNVLASLGDDNESLASHDAPKPAKKRGGKDKNLAKQVGDRAVERAKEGWSPSAASDDEVAGSAGKKRARDPDGTYRVKGSKGGAGKGSKRKRSGGDEVAGGKKRRIDDDEEGEDDEGGYAGPAGS